MKLLQKPKFNSFFLPVLILMSIGIGLSSCKTESPVPEYEFDFREIALKKPPMPDFILLDYNISARSYFHFIDSLIAHLDTTLKYRVNEYTLVHANPWLIDTLAHTDYYYLKSRGIYKGDLHNQTVLKKGKKLIIPDSLQADSLNRKLQGMVIDVNIPEYKLRILSEGKTLYTFPVRVGRVEQKYLAMAGREVDLRTRKGEGSIIRVNRFPVFINPSDNKIYHSTRRDDGERTQLPIVPWIEPELDGIRYGQMIHPTTNPVTLGKAYSNGCIGIGEGDMWKVYYYAPLGTKVVVRYDLQVIEENRDTIMLKDIYPGYQKIKRRKPAMVSAFLKENPGKHVSVCDCGMIE